MNSKMAKVCLAALVLLGVQAAEATPMGEIVGVEADGAAAACSEWITDSFGLLQPNPDWPWCEDTTTTAPPPPPPPTTPPPPPPVTTTTEQDSDGDGYPVSSDSNDNSAPVAGEADDIGELPFGEGLLQQMLVDGLGNEVTVEDYLESAAADSLPQDIQDRLREIEELGLLIDDMAVSTDEDGDGYTAGPDGGFSKVLHDAGLYGGDLSDVLPGPGSEETIRALEAAGVELGAPVTVILADGESAEFETGSDVLDQVGESYAEFVPDWAVHVEEYEAELAALEAALTTTTATEPQSESSEDASSTTVLEESAATASSGESDPEIDTAVVWASGGIAVAGVLFGFWWFFKRRNRKKDEQ